MPRRTLSRRNALKLGLAGAAGLAGGTRLLGASGAAALVNPYSGSIPMAFPLAGGVFVSPLADNWHDSRDGVPFDWSHRKGQGRRHDGVDLYPADPTRLPPVFAPLAGVVVAKAVDGAYARGSGGPPYNYPADDIYGNFVWVRSTESASAGYYAFFCHLQPDAALDALVPGATVTRDSRLGTMGDTGNAAGSPQLHVELHYPLGADFRCTRCKPKTRLTAMDPFASLAAASPRA